MHITPTVAIRTVIIVAVAAYLGFLLATGLGLTRDGGMNWIEHLLQAGIAATAVILLATVDRRRSRA
jgi:hypothetical protein